LNKPPAWLNESIAGDFRQSTEEFSLALHDMGALQERIKLLQEEVVASVNERTSRAIFVLTAVTVLALPVNMIAGLFGMNVGGIPYAESSHGFWIVSGLVATISTTAAWLIFRGNRD
jgi:zinc transporter